MKRALQIAIAAAMVLGLGLPAQADSIKLTPTTVSCAAINCSLALSGPQTSQAEITALINSAFPGLSVLYDADQTSPVIETGAFAFQYDTTFDSESLANADATISFVGSSFITSNPVFALIKDGRIKDGIPTAWYFYNITGWNGVEDIQFSGYFNGNQGRISHVAIYGTGVPQVPDGGSTAMLLGMAFIAVGAARRFFK